MDFLKVHCFHCKGDFELYSRNMNHDDKPPRCPHCLKIMNKVQWERLVDAYYTFAEVNKNFRKYHEDRGEAGKDCDRRLEKMEEQAVMNKFVCGMVVDEDIYDKYNFDKETKGRRMYTLCGQERSLMAIEFYANSADYAKESPEVVAEAKKIAAQIQKEIREYYAAKDGRKEYVAMKHDTFDGYLKDLQEIHAKAAPERRELKEKMDMARKRWEENQREFKGDEHYLAREKVRYLDAQEEYKNSVKELQRRTQEEIQAVQSEYEKHVTDFYTANGNRLDDAAVRLLNSGIKLTDTEIDGMVSQNTGNPTMLRLLCDHCEKMGIENQNARIFGSLARKVGSDEREAFKVIADMVRNAVSEDETTSSVWSKEESHFKRLSDQQIGAMNAFWVRPEVSEAAE